MQSSQEQFLQRAGRIFDVGQAARWTRLQKAVFNKLIGDLVYCHGYSRISDEMLKAAKANMERITAVCMRRSKESHDERYQ